MVSTLKRGAVIPTSVHKGFPRAGTLRSGAYSSTLSYMYKHILRNWGVQNKNVMGLLSFTSAFEISIKHSKEEAFKRFLSYVNQSRNLKLTETEEFEKMSFTKGTSLFSWPIEFSITFKEIDKDSTQLSVSSASSSLDFGQAKGIINDIVKEIY